MITHFIFNIWGIQNPLIGMLLSLNTYLVIFVLILWIRKRIKLIGAIRALVFWNDGTQDLRSYKIKEGRLQIRPKSILKRQETVWCPKVTSQNIIPPKMNVLRKLSIFGFKQKDIIIAVEGSPECVKIKGVIEEEDLKDQVQSKLLRVYTPEEITDLIRKAIAIGTVNRRIFNDTQFYIFVVLILFNLMMSFLMARRIGLF